MMTQRARNQILFFFLFIFFPSCFIFLFALFSFLNIPTNFSFFIDHPALPQLISKSLILNGIFLCFCFFSALIVFWNFRNTSSLEVFFLVCYLCSCSLFAIQPLQAILCLQESSIPIQNFCAKIFFFTHFFSLTMLFFMSFYKLRFEFNYAEWTFLFFLLLGLIFSELIPFDQTLYKKALLESKSHLPSVLLHSGFFQGRLFIFLSIIFSILGFINFCITAYHSQNRHFWWLAGCLIFLSFTTATIAFHAHWILQTIALSLFPCVIITFGVLSHRIYKWS